MIIASRAYIAASAYVASAMRTETGHVRNDALASGCCIVYRTCRGYYYISASVGIKVYLRLPIGMSIFLHSLKPEAVTETLL